jgi:hypothetical protein
VALRWSLQKGGDASLGVRLAAALWRFWYMSGHLSEARRWLEMALASTDGHTTERAQALNGAGNIALTQGMMRTPRPGIQSVWLWRAS